MVLSVDVKKNKNSWDAYMHGGRINSGLDALEWIEQGESLGAGEILLNSINRDGTRDGYDLELIYRVSQKVNIPVIASGGAGTLEHLLQAITRGGADAILLASILHTGEYRIQDIKHYLKQKGVEVRC
jgi:cyclase